jgi:HPt (histidine-containing phosphotransfer) domain-containing protein
MRFDLTALLHMVEGDEELLCEMLAIFLNTYAHQLEVVRTALADEDPTALVKAAHRMKGSLSVLAVRELTDMAAELERLGKRGTLHGAKRLFESLEEGVQAFAAVAKEVIESSRH